MKEMIFRNSIIKLPGNSNSEASGCSSVIYQDDGMCHSLTKVAEKTADNVTLICLGVGRVGMGKFYFRRAQPY